MVEIYRKGVSLSRKNGHKIGYVLFARIPAPTATPPKAVLANKVERAPFYALYPLKPGLTRTFGGLRINTGCQVVEADGTSIRGLYAAGEVTAGFFSIDYVGGGSLSRCVVTGRAAGKNAAKEA